MQAKGSMRWVMVSHHLAFWIFVLSCFFFNEKLVWFPQHQVRGFYFGFHPAFRSFDCCCCCFYFGLEPLLIQQDVTSDASQCAYLRLRHVVRLPVGDRKRLDFFFHYDCVYFTPGIIGVQANEREKKKKMNFATAWISETNWNQFDFTSFYCWSSYVKFTTPLVMTVSRNSRKVVIFLLDFLVLARPPNESDKTKQYDWI